MLTPGGGAPLVGPPVTGVWGVVLAAGSGRRFGTVKQFERLGPARLIDHAVAATAAACDGVVVVVPADRRWDGAAATAVAGGATRSASVRAALAAVPTEAAIIVIHDAAHPLASPALFERVVAAVARGGASAAAPVVAVTETVRQVEEGEVRATLPAAGLFATQLPCAFRSDVLREAHEGAPEAADDTVLVEQAGHRVRLVAGDPRNLHVTVPAELAMVRALADADPALLAAG